MARIEGGKKLATALAEMSRGLSKAASLKVGFLSGATYPDGKPVALIAAIQEFGAPARNIPPRPFFRGMVNRESNRWPVMVGTQLKAANYDATKALALVGEGIKGQLQQSIRDLTEPPLAPATIRRKGFDKPLIDSSQMLNSVDYEVS